MTENQTIGDVYAANDQLYETTKQFAAALADEQHKLLTEDGKWTLAQIFEHIALVHEAMTKISARLLSQAQASGGTADGKLNLSAEFIEKATQSQQKKLEAPEQLQPTGTVLIADALLKMAETRKILESLRPLFETVECSQAKFPHPFMGDLSAHEWLVLIGRHEARHHRQIKSVLEK